MPDCTANCTFEVFYNGHIIFIIRKLLVQKENIRLFLAARNNENISKCAFHDVHSVSILLFKNRVSRLLEK